MDSCSDPEGTGTFRRVPGFRFPVNRVLGFPSQLDVVLSFGVFTQSGTFIDFDV